VGEGATIAEVRSTVGGGSLPGETLPSIAVAVDRAAARRSVGRLLAALRESSPAVVGRIEGGRALFDLRTVDPSEDAALAAALRQAIASSAP
jgi:L-seryl-tRNA(Ser) seleniumtransferase